MTHIRASEAKNSFESLLDRVEQNEEIVITRHGKPVARLIPIQRDFNRRQAEAAAKRIRARARQLRAGTFDWKKLKTDTHGSFSAREH